MSEEASEREGLHLCTPAPTPPPSGKRRGEVSRKPGGAVRVPLPASPQKRGRSQMQNSQLPLDGVEAGQDGGGGFPRPPSPCPTLDIQ